MKHTLSRPLRTTLMPMAFSLAFSTTSFAEISAAIIAKNDEWIDTFNNKNVEHLSRLYTTDALVATSPYDPNNATRGFEKIQQSLVDGPFKLNGARIYTQSLSADENPSRTTGLTVKKYRVEGQGGSLMSTGMAIKVLKRIPSRNFRLPDQWRWSIELSGENLKDITGFAEERREMDNSAFNYLTDRLNSSPQGFIGEKTLNIDTPLEEIPHVSPYTQVNNLQAIRNGNQGLLITKVQTSDVDYLTINAVEYYGGQWRIAVQYWKRLPNDTSDDAIDYHLNN